MNYLKTFWAFSRPHTIIGSFLSIVSLFMIAGAITSPGISPENLNIHLPVLWPTLIAALACNVYITGLNQLQDIEIDKINKPWLPIPSGRLSINQARWIIAVCGILALVSAAFTNHVLLILIGVIMLVGTAYSMPPLKFKRHHLAAAASILFVRGVLVNVGMPVHFLYAFTGKLRVPPDVWPLTFFVVGFSLAIAWFKDIPDTGGDSAFKIKTLALSLSPKAAFRYGVAVVALSYAGLLVLAAFLHLRVNHHFFFSTHAVLLLLFLAGASRVQLNEPKKLKIFYLVFWGFFFAEYIVYGLSYYLH
jgi:homogentisate phytyltransferase/homogentisate geranylgeranyltransferase